MKTIQEDNHVSFTIPETLAVVLYGKTSQTPRTLAINHGANSEKICLINCSKNPTVKITKPVFNNVHEYNVHAEGVVLTESGSAAVLKTADCPSLVLYDRKNRTAIITHAGRSALTPKEVDDGVFTNIVTTAYNAIVNRQQNPSIIAHITGSICGDCFLHDDNNGVRLAEPFVRHFGSEVITQNKGLDLSLVIKKQLIELGMSECDISNDGLCTFESKNFCSYRRGDKQDRNVVILVLR